MELCCSQRTKYHHKFICFQVKLSTRFRSPSKARCKTCEFYEALHAGLKFHRSQGCGVKLIDTYCKTVAVMVSYDSILHVCELCGHEVCREFLVNTIVVHMK